MGHGRARPSASREEEAVTRGTVVWVDLSDTTPPEMGKKRPALIVSSSAQNQVLDTLVVVPLSSQAPEIPPLRVRVVVAALKRPGFAIVPGLRQIKRSRILGKTGSVTAGDLAKVDRAIHDYLSD
jgi:mRNA interferase MazF